MISSSTNPQAGDGMAQLVVRNIDEDVKTRLKRRAESHGRSMEEEARQILTEAVLRKPAREKGLGTRIAARFKGLQPLEIPELRDEQVTPADFDR